MLIVLGGFLGSGRKLLAHYLALNKGFHHVPVDAHKIHKFKEKEGHIVERKMSFKTDALRKRAYELVLADMPLISKMYANVVVEDSFHRKGLRDFFCAEIRKYFDDAIFVWVDSDERLVRERLTRMHEKGLIGTIEGALARRQRAIEQFEPFDKSVLTFHFRERNEKDAADSLLRLIQGAPRLPCISSETFETP